MTLFAYLPNILKRSASIRFPLASKTTPNTINTNKFSSVTTITSKKIYDISTNVAKDVILFKYENPKYFTYMNIFAVAQYVFWSYLGVFAFSSLKDAPVDRSKITDDTPWFRRINLGDNKYKNTLGAVSLIIGTGSLALIWMYTLKSVRFLILNKGGKHLTFVTYAPFGENRIMKVPIECVSCKESRSIAKVQLPLKVKNRAMHYMLDMRGHFTNPLLFDCTAGLSRKL